MRSISSMSLEKRLMMRPTGVVSKKAMVEDKILLRRSLCNLTEAFKVPMVIIITAIRMKIAYLERNVNETDLRYTVWKISNFPATLILREINVG